MPEQGYYYISALGKDGINYYYHSNKQFYWNFWSLPTKHFKKWQKCGYAQRSLYKIMNKSQFQSIRLMFCPHGLQLKGNSIVIKTLEQ